MKISVVIPLYNKEKHIKHTIDTVLVQTHTDFELIVVDDGSTDHSGDIVDSINDERIRYHRKGNEGVSATRNKGVDLAVGELVAFLDADDEWEPNYLERIVSLSEKYPEAALLATNYCVVERNGERYSLDYPGVPEHNTQGLIDNYFVSAFQYTPLWTSAVCVKKAVFLQMGGFPTDIKNGEDLDLWCRMALRYPIAYDNTPLAIYRRDSENMLSRSITVPCWYPFLETYKMLPHDIIQDSSSVEKYIVQRQLEAVSASLFVIRDRKMGRKLLRSVKYKKWNRKKYYGMKYLSLQPQRVIDQVYKIRMKNIKRFD